MGVTGTIVSTYFVNCFLHKGARLTSTTPLLPVLLTHIALSMTHVATSILLLVIVIANLRVILLCINFGRITVDSNLGYSVFEPYPRRGRQTQLYWRNQEISKTCRVLITWIARCFLNWSNLYTYIFFITTVSWRAWPILNSEIIFPLIDNCLHLLEHFSLVMALLTYFNIISATASLHFSIYTPINIHRYTHLTPPVTWRGRQILKFQLIYVLNSYFLLLLPYFLPFIYETSISPIQFICSDIEYYLHTSP